MRASAISALIRNAIGDVDTLATEDRDRTQGHLLEVWYILGFKGATGHARETMRERFCCLQPARSNTQ